MKQPILVALVTLLAHAVSPNKPSAQFLYLDSNGDGVSSSDDVLNPQGVPTSVGIYLNTSRNPDSSATFCSIASEPLTLNSYEFIVRAAGGTVIYGNYANAQPSMTTSLGQNSSATDFYAGFGGGSILSPGLYHLGTLIVTVQEGLPSLVPSAATSMDARCGTTFGTKCRGQEQDNTYRLGIDWHGIAGCGPPEGGSSQVYGAVPGAMDFTEGSAIDITGEFAKHGSTDPIEITLQGLPPGFSAVEGAQYENRRQARVYGIVGHIEADSEYQLQWEASSGSSSQTVTSTIRMRPHEGGGPDLNRKVHDLMYARYERGFNRRQVRELGTSALPILSGMLRDAQHKGVWPNVARAIGCLGDTAYFDTLRSFVWERFRGEVDYRTYMGIRIAQATLGPMATRSVRIQDYLLNTCDPSAWAGLQWSVSPYTHERLARTMSEMSIIALGYTDSQSANDELLRLSTTPYAPSQRYAISESLQRNAEVRRTGYVRVWAAEDPRPIKISH